VVIDGRKRLAAPSLLFSPSAGWFLVGIDCGNFFTTENAEDAKRAIFSEAKKHIRVAGELTKAMSRESIKITSMPIGSSDSFKKGVVKIVLGAPIGSIQKERCDIGHASSMTFIIGLL
jgi:hypothetical protein